jgi:peptidoglycan/xylan/chitin deacetylase (PgdA/CDA1 family)
LNAHAGSPFPGALVISLDFELHWGVRDKHSSHSRFTRNLYGARTVIPRLLELFEEFGIAATWAVVGFLFAASREELARFSPTLRPAYRRTALSPYGERIGVDEDEDPLHFAPSLIRLIQHTPRQEIATHTFSHYYCEEEGQSRETFRADLSAACAIASRYGIQLRSIAFPRNQHNPAYDDILSELGVRAYRGNPVSRGWRSANTADARRPWRRAARLLDAYFGSAAESTTGWAEIQQPNGLSNVRASCLLRPYRPALRHLERRRLERICHSLHVAAQTGRMFHLWWHPHNVGIHQEQNLRFLRGIFSEFAACRERHDMRSLSMAEVDAYLRTRPRRASGDHAVREPRTSGPVRGLAP